MQPAPFLFATEKSIYFFMKRYLSDNLAQHTFAGPCLLPMSRYNNNNKNKNKNSKKNNNNNMSTDPPMDGFKDRWIA